MEDRGTPADVYRRMKNLVPLSEADANELHRLLQGVHAAAARMAELAPVFPAEVDPARMSLNVDGDDV